MSRLKILVAVGIWVAVGLAFFAVLENPAREPGPEAASITVREIVNRVEVDAQAAFSDAPAFVGLDVDRSLEAGNLVKTHNRSEARIDIAIEDFTRISRTVPNTIWRLGEFALRDSAVIELETGEVFVFDAGENEEHWPFHIVTPAGTGTARGTWMSVIFEPDTGIIEVLCFRAVCELGNEHGRQLLGNQETSTATAGAAPNPPQAMTPEQIAKFVALPEARSGEVPIPAISVLAQIPATPGAATSGTRQAFDNPVNARETPDPIALARPRYEAKKAKSHEPDPAIFSSNNVEEGLEDADGLLDSDGVQEALTPTVETTENTVDTITSLEVDETVGSVQEEVYAALDSVVEEVSDSLTAALDLAGVDDTLTSALDLVETGGTVTSGFGGVAGAVTSDAEKVGGTVITALAVGGTDGISGSVQLGGIQGDLLEGPSGLSSAVKGDAAAAPNAGLANSIIGNPVASDQQEINVQDGAHQSGGEPDNTVTIAQPVEVVIVGHWEESSAQVAQPAPTPTGGTPVPTPTPAPVPTPTLTPQATATPMPTSAPTATPTPAPTQTPTPAPTPTPTPAPTPTPTPAPTPTPTPVPNNPPSASGDSASTAVLGSVTIDVLANDSDADGDALTVTNLTQPAVGGGVVVLNGDNSVLYTAPALPGEHTFTYTANDGTDDSETATVTVTVTLS